MTKSGLLPGSIRRRAILAAVLGAVALLVNPATLGAQEAAGDVPDLAAEDTPNLIGDSARDLVFTPVPRCRVIDTRVAGGRLTADIPRDFDVAGALAGQGGASNCLISDSATAVVINLMVVHPAGPGTLTAWPVGGTMPTASLINFNSRARAGGNAANEVVLPICDAAASSCPHDLAVQASGSDTHLVADVAGYFSKVAGLTVPWTAVTEKPAGFDDDTDNDTQYSAGAGLTLAGTEFNVNTSVIQSRVTVPCPPGSSIRTILANGAVTCETDDDTNTTYTAGTGLLLAGTTFNVNPAVVQSRVLVPCPPTTSIRMIDAAGGVTCEPDNDTTYGAGAGLNLVGSTFSVGNLEITGAMLAAGAVGAGKIAVNAVSGAEIADRTVNTAEIAVGAITNAELSSFAVGLNKIASGVVGQAEIATDGVAAAEIATGAVGADEIASGAVGRSELDGTERAIYRLAAACHAGDGITTSTTCSTPLCTPVPIPLFWSCGNNCDSIVPVNCDNTLLGYLLSPNIE